MDSRVEMREGRCNRGKPRKRVKRGFDSTGRLTPFVMSAFQDGTFSGCSPLMREEPFFMAANKSRWLRPPRRPVTSGARNTVARETHLC